MRQSRNLSYRVEVFALVSFTKFSSRKKRLNFGFEAS